jgi:hypothetical protein
VENTYWNRIEFTTSILLLTIQKQKANAIPFPASPHSPFFSIYTSPALTKTSKPNLLRKYKKVKKKTSRQDPTV